MKLETIMIGLFGIIIIISTVILVNDCWEGCESCDICAFEMNETKFGINGFYSTIGFYCVWTKDKTAKHIASVEEHEKCHALIDKNYEHFCEIGD